MLPKHGVLVRVSTVGLTDDKAYEVQALVPEAFQDDLTSCSAAFDHCMSAL